jgi:hypothetical protein
MKRSVMLAALLPAITFSTVVAAGQVSSSSRITDLEEKIRELQQEVRDLKNQEPANVSGLEERVSKLESAPPPVCTGCDGDTGNVVFFRGGYFGARNDRAYEVFTDLYGLAGRVQNEDNGWYIGAGFDFVLTKDVWGMMSKNSGIWVDAELGVEWKRLESLAATDASGAIRVVPGATAILTQNAGLAPGVLTGNTPVLNAAAASLRGITMSYLTVSAAPKIKFMETPGSKLHPWVIPAGMAFHVASPPSNAGTVLAPGVMFGAGLEYDLWRGIKVGIDGRYHLVSDELDGLKIDHYTLGGYVGIGF